MFSTLTMLVAISSIFVSTLVIPVTGEKYWVQHIKKVFFIVVEPLRSGYPSGSKPFFYRLD